MMYEQGDIVVVPFPFSDLSNVKQRPVLILSKNKDIDRFDDVITCGITSNLKNAEHSIIIDKRDLESGEIPAKSRIKVDKLFTLDKDTIKKKVAKVNKVSMEGVRKEFNKLV